MIAILAFCGVGYGRILALSSEIEGLEGENGTTQLTFVQDYAKDLSEEAYGRYNFSWGYYLDSLRQYCETGRGKPFQQV